MIDHQTVDWARIERATFQVRVHYRYTYSGPVTNLRQRLIVIPPDRRENQRVLDHKLDVRGALGAQDVQWGKDTFGNRLCRVTIERVEQAIDFEVSYRLERWGSQSSRAEPGGSPAIPASKFIRHTALTAPDERLRAVAREIVRESSSSEERIMRAHEWTSGALTYQYGVTNVQTPAAMALHFGKGVCQDYAHILITVLRLLKIGARYVSGHLPGDGAPHAWVEALLDDPSAPGGHRVIALDPTHRRAADLRHLTVAVGRDYSDVSPTSGIFSGAASGRLSSSKQASPLELTSAGIAEDVA
jgi:transglutaminase-like putative cysteine protease